MKIAIAAPQKSRHRRMLWRSALIALVLLALALRLTFILWTPQVPPTAGDSTLYIESATLYLRSVLGACRSVFGEAASCGLTLPANAELRHFYDAHGFDPTTPGPVSTALAPSLLGDLSAQRAGLTPLLYSGLFWVFGPDPTVLTIAQALIDSLTIFAIALLSRRLGRAFEIGESTSIMLGLLAGVVAAIYPPLITSTGRLLQQPLAVFFVAWGFYALLVALESRRRRILWIALTLLLLAGFTVAVLRLLALGVAVLTIVLHWWPQDRRSMAQAALWFLLGIVGLSLGLGILFRGQPYGALEWPGRLLLGLDTSTAGSINLTAYLPTDGWHTDENWIAPFTTPESQPLLDALLADPEAVIGQLITNVYRLWLSPYNDYAQPFLMPYWTQVGLHQALVILAVIGLGASLMQGKRWPWLFAAFLAGLTLAYAQYHIEARYNAVATPLVIVLAVMGVWQVGIRIWRVRTWQVSLFLFTLLLFLSSFEATWLPRNLAHSLAVVSGLLIWAMLLGYMWELLNWRNRRWGTFTGAFCVTLFLLVWGGYQLHDSSWRGQLLDDSNTLRQQIITLLPDAASRPGDAYLILEIGDGAKVAVSDQVSSAYELSGTRIEDELIPWEVALGVPLDGGQYDTLLTLGAETVTDFPHYVAWPVPPELLAGERIVVTVDGPIWEDLLPDEPGVSIIPSPRRWDDARSMFLAIWGKEDRRIPVRYEWDGVDYTSEFYTVSGEWTTDLLGLPSSVYRIYLVWDTGPIREP